MWAVTKFPYSMLAATLTGVLIDLDHLLEYYRWFIKEDHTRVWLFLHSYELVVPAFLAGYLSGWDPVVLGVSFAFLGHLLTDQLTNPVGPLAYFFTYRGMKGFQLHEIVNSDWETIERVYLRMPMARTILGIFNPKLRVGK